MSTTAEEKPVTPEPPKTIRDHYEAAKAAQSSSPEDDQGTPEVAPDDTPAEQPAEQPDKVADPPTETTETQDALLTAEEVGKLSPKEKKLYEKAQKNYTQKTQALAAERKEIESWKPLMESWKSNPDAALEQLARQRGFSLTRPQQDTTAKEQAKEIVDQLPDELAFLEKPLETRIQKALDARLKPLEEREAQRNAQTAAAETKATLEAFSAKYKGWEKHEPAMMKLGEKLLPTGGMSDFEYMENLYKLATADIDKAEEAKKVVARMEKSVAAAESPTTGVAEGRVEHRKPSNITSQNAFREAYKAAKQGIVWGND